MALSSEKIGVRPPPRRGWTDRPDFLLTCILMGLNAPQIVKLSLSTPQPITTTQQVYDMIESHGHRSLFMSKKIQRRRQGTHNEKLISTFAKLYGQAVELGHEVTDVFRDQVPFPGVKFRPDIGLRISPRQFYIEVQISKLQLTRWTPKLSNYLKLYRIARQPFRVLVLFDRPDDLSRLREYARWALRHHPSLNLYLFMSLDEFARHWNVMHERVWCGAWDSKERFALL